MGCNQQHIGQASLSLWSLATGSGRSSTIFRAFSCARQRQRVCNVSAGSRSRCFGNRTGRRQLLPAGHGSAGLRTEVSEVKCVVASDIFHGMLSRSRSSSESKTAWRTNPAIQTRLNECALSEDTLRRHFRANAMQKKPKDLQGHQGRQGVL